jgi:hypothetical protein
MPLIDYDLVGRISPVAPPLYVYPPPDDQERVQLHWTSTVSSVLSHLIMHCLLKQIRYWEEILDTGNLTASPIFDTTYGFGGDGSGNDSCITDGPFANTTLHLGPIYEVTDHCISRSLNSVAIAWANQTYLDECYAAQNYSVAWPLFSSHPHTAGHAAVAGTVSRALKSGA